MYDALDPDRSDLDVYAADRGRARSAGACWTSAVAPRRSRCSWPSAAVDVIGVDPARCVAGRRACQAAEPSACAGSTEMRRACHRSRRRPGDRVDRRDVGREAIADESDVASGTLPRCRTSRVAPPVAPPRVRHHGADPACVGGKSSGSSPANTNDQREPLGLGDVRRLGDERRRTRRSSPRTTSIQYASSSTSTGWTFAVVRVREARRFDAAIQNEPAGTSTMPSRMPTCVAAGSTARPAHLPAARRCCSIRPRSLDRRTRSSAAASISSSETRTSRAASPSGTNESLLVTRAIRPSKPASTSSAMTPSETPPVRRVSSTTSTRPGGVRLAQDVLDRERREPAEVEHARADRPAAREPARDAQRELEPVRPGHDREVVAVEVRARRADGHVLVGERRDPAVVALLVQVARVVQRDRLEEDADRCRRRAPTRRTSRASRPRRPAAPATRSRGPGMSRSTPTASSLWKCPPKPRW